MAGAGLPSWWALPLLRVPTSSAVRIIPSIAAAAAAAARGHDLLLLRASSSEATGASSSTSAPAAPAHATAELLQPRKDEPPHQGPPPPHVLVRGHRVVDRRGRTGRARAAAEATSRAGVRRGHPRLLVIGRTGPISRAGVRHDPTHEAAHRAAHSGSDQAAAPTPTGANTCGRTSRSDQPRSSGTRQ